MEQIQRIRQMEETLTQAEAVVARLQADLAAYQALQGKLQALERYYQSPLWQQEFDDSCSGKLPADLLCGVLSEDAVYDLLSLRDELVLQMKAL